MDRLRMINLIEVLREDAEAEGAVIDGLDEDELLGWSEADVHAFFASGGKARPAAAGAAAAWPAARAPADSAPTAATAAAPQLQSWDEPPAEELRKWFPALKPGALESARVVVLCFPNSGSCEDMYSSEGTGARRVASPLLEWCRETGAVLMAAQPPGRALRRGEPCLPDLRALAAAALPLAARALLRARRYFVVGHSVGAWAAYEFLRLAQSRGLPMPAAAFVSAMPAPDIPEHERPWRRQATLQDEAFKEECRGWDINEVVFSPDMWASFEPLLRADFQLFDEYTHAHPAPGARGSGGGGGGAAEGAPPFAFPVTAFWGDRDRRITERMVQAWARFTSGPFQLVRVAGANHLWPSSSREAKQEWLARIVAGMQRLDAD